jgi:hypothetical protein
VVLQRHQEVEQRPRADLEDLAEVALLEHKVSLPGSKLLKQVKNVKLHV